MNKHNLISRLGKSIDVRLVPSSRDYGIIHIPTENADFFPGYRIPFVLDTNVKPFIMHMTGADNGTEIGSSDGGYICHPRGNSIPLELIDLVEDTTNNILGSFKRFYDANLELDTQVGPIMRITKVPFEKDSEFMKNLFILSGPLRYVPNKEDF